MKNNDKNQLEGCKDEEPIPFIGPTLKDLEGWLNDCITSREESWRMVCSLYGFSLVDLEEDLERPTSDTPNYLLRERQNIQEIAQSYRKEIEQAVEKGISRCPFLDKDAQMKVYWNAPIMRKEELYIGD